MGKSFSKKKYHNIKRDLYRIYWKLQKIIVPSLRYIESQLVYEGILNSYVNNHIKWLDLGCGSHILPEWRLKEEKQLVANCKMVVGIDYDFHSLNKHTSIPLILRGDIVELSIKDNSFDIVSANMVVEHLKNPEAAFKEIRRILKPGGIFIFHTPNALGYKTISARLIPNKIKDKIIYFLEARKEEDVFSTYYRVNTIKDINNLAKISLFNNVKTKMCVSTAEFILITPLVILELIWIRVLTKRLFKALRTNIITIFEKHFE